MNISKARQREKQYNKLLFNVIADFLVVMETQGVTRAALAETMGKDKSSVTRLLSGRRNVTLRTLSDVAFALEKKARVVLTDRPLEGEVNARRFNSPLNLSRQLNSTGSVVTNAPSSPSCGDGVVSYAKTG